MVHAAHYSTPLLHYSIKNGFPSNNVYSVIQDRHGYLWFATDNGVVKYNGYSFKIFNTESGLPANDVWKLFEDSYGRIWLHSYMYEVGYLENDQYHKLPLTPSKAVIAPQDIMEQNGMVVFFYERNRVLPTLVIAGRDFIGEVPVAPMEIWQLTEQGLLYGVMPDRERIYRLDLFKPGTKAEYVDRIKDFRYKFLSQYRLFNENARYYVAYDNGAATIRLHNIATDSSRTAYVSELLAGEEDETIYGIINKYPGYQFFTNKRVGQCTYDFKNIKTDTASYTVAKQAQIAFSLTAKNRDNWYTTTSQGIYQYISVPAVFNRENTWSLPPDAGFVDKGINGNLYWQDKLSNGVYMTDTGGHVSRLPFESCGKLFSVLESDSDSMICFSFSSGIYEMNRKTHRYLLFLDKFKRVIRRNTELFSMGGESEIFTTAVEKKYIKNQRRLLYAANGDIISAGLGAVHYFHAQDTDMTVWTINN